MYRHSRGRRISETLFGIFANRWRIFHTVILHEPKAVESIVLGTLALHNMLITSSIRGIYCPAGLTDTEDVTSESTYVVWWNDICTDSMFPLEIPAKGHDTSIYAKEIRGIFA